MDNCGLLWCTRHRWTWRLVIDFLIWTERDDTMRERRAYVIGFTLGVFLAMVLK